MPGNKQSATALAVLLGATAISAAPCDIYATGNTPCVAAHSTTRALYSKFNGALYQVKRSDGQLKDIPTLGAGEAANSGVQDTFCSGKTCLISIIYDQSGNGNHLKQAPPNIDAKKGTPDDKLADATAAPVTLGGKKVYGLYSVQGVGYRAENTKNIAVKDEPEGIYAVLDGTHYNSKCCFDYGNAERVPHDDGQGTMESLYFGSGGAKNKQNHLAGSGPWVEADLENGLYGSLSASSPSPSVNYRFIHATLRGGHDRYALAGGNAVSGQLTTYYDGVRPKGNYTTMNKEGGIILGIGGDNSDGAVGTWYEGVLTKGFPSDATENSVQANIVAAKYAA